jgi:putative spermidine/putrescine transport system substrate-binding protein
MSKLFAHQFSRRTVLGAAMFAGASWLLKSCAADTATDSPQGSGQFVAAVFPGTTETLAREKLAPEFTQATGTQVSLVPLLAFEQVARLQASKTNPPFDVVLLDDGQTNIATSEGLIQQFPADSSENTKNVESAFLSTEGFAPIFYAQGVVLAYNTERIQTPPTSWEALSNSNLSGSAGLVSMNSVLGTSFMVELARTRGGGESNIEPAFSMLQEILPNVNGVAANPGALLTLFQQGEVDIAPMWHNDAAYLKTRGIPVEWVVPESGLVGARYSMNVVSNPRSGLDVAVSYIDTALSDEVQSYLSSSPYFYIPANSNVPLAPEIAEQLQASNLTEFMQRVSILDWKTINTQRSAWIERFNREVQA